MRLLDIQANHSGGAVFKTLAKALGITLLVLGVLIAAGISATIGWRPFIGPKVRPLTSRTFESTPARLERGRYLATAVTGCMYCHSDLETSEPGEGITFNAAVEGAGRSMAAEGLPFLHSVNLTPDKETGIGNISDDALARAIREGIGQDGWALFPMMPYVNFRHMSDEDLASVVVYLRSLKPIARPHPKPTTPFPLNRLINAGPQPLDSPVPPPDLSTPVKRGEYMTTLAGCSDCHTPMNDRGEYLEHLRFAGGTMVKIEGARPDAAAKNLTPATNGIPYYTEELFLETIRTGRVRERQLSDLMPWKYYREMTDEDLKAIFAYLKTLKPIEHYVDNEVPATDCKQCGSKHGGGERNKAAD
jgi:mono/diheme cytochrome c family protein